LKTTRGELTAELASELTLESVEQAAVSKEAKLPLSVSVSSSESSRSAQHTPDRRVLPVRTSAFAGTIGELPRELAGDATLELVGDVALKDTKLLQRNTPLASSSAAFSCTHSGSIKDRKGLLRF